MVTQEIYNPESDKVKFSLKEDTPNTGQFIFNNENDTLGNLLQSLMHNHYIRNKKPTANNHILSYIGYYCPHPLEETMILQISFDDDETEIKEIEYLDVLKEHCTRSLTHLQEIQNAWLEQYKE